MTVLYFAFEAQEAAALMRGDIDTARLWGAHRQAVEDAVRLGAAASVDYLARHGGYTRTGHHGPNSGTWADAHTWTVASFLQHDSRNHDPQLHVHQAILNKVQGDDEKWRAIDWTAVKVHKNAAGAVGDRAMFERLTATLGITVAERADGAAREIVGIDQRIIDLFSSRTHAITPKTQQLVDRFEATRGRAPNALELYQLSKVATMATRPSKSHTGETAEQRLSRWDQMVRDVTDGVRTEVDAGLAGVAWSALRAANREQAAGRSTLKRCAPWLLRKHKRSGPGSPKPTLSARSTVSYRTTWVGWTPGKSRTWFGDRGGRRDRTLHEVDGRRTRAGHPAGRGTVSERRVESPATDHGSVRIQRPPDVRAGHLRRRC